MTGVEVKGTHDPTPWEGHMAGWDQKEASLSCLIAIVRLVNQSVSYQQSLCYDQGYHPDVSPGYKVSLVLVMYFQLNILSHKGI